MPDYLNVRLEGEANLIRRLGNLSTALKDEVLDEFEATTEDIRNLSIQNLNASGTGDQGHLRASMQILRNGELQTVEFLIEAFYAPFLEFGTKTRVANLSGDWAAYAATFRGKKNGTLAEFKQNMRDWVKRKGITPYNSSMTQDQLSDFFTYKILKFGLRPRPYLRPAFEQATRDLAARIANILNKSLS